MRNIQLVPAVQGQLETLTNLAQLYLYDFSKYLGEEEIDEYGLFDLGYPIEQYFQRPNHWAYLARVDDRLGGFVLVNDRLRHRQGAGRYVAEFFVLRVYRRQGVGRALAFQTFNTHRGYWEVAQILPNKPAQAFWRKVIAEYTGGRYKEFTTPGDDWDDVWQVFDSGTW